MTFEDFRTALEWRGGQADVWLTYRADPYEWVTNAIIVLSLDRAYWTRGEAYARASHGRDRRQWRHYYVFRVIVTLDWLSKGEARSAEFETEFGRSRELPEVLVTPEQVAAALS